MYEEPNDAPGHRMAYVLAHWPTDTVPRSVLRAVLPEGATRRAPQATIMARYTRRANPSKSQNLTTRRYKNTLARWEARGFLRREGQEHVVILDREVFRTSAARLPPQIAEHVHRMAFGPS